MASEVQDRRTGARAETRRRAFLRRRGAMRASIEVEIQDISPTGLRLLGRAPLCPGDEVEIEVEATASDVSAIAVRGTVRHASSIESGHVAGVQLVVTLGTDAPALTSLEEARRHLTALREAMAHLPLNDAAGLGAMLTEDSPTTADRPPSRRRWPYVALMLLLILFASLYAAEEWREESGTRAQAFRPWWRAANEPPQIATTPTPDALIKVAFQPEISPREQAWELLRRGGTATSGPADAFSPESPLNFLDLWLKARLESAKGNQAEALRWSGLLLEMDERGNVPESWRTRVAELRKELITGANTRNEVPLPLLAILHEPSEVRDLPVNSTMPERVEGIHLDVDTAAYTLYVWRNGALLGAFPVGLGEPGKTPKGRFVVNRKIYKPDWYDRGRVVPYGEPENPLGDYWMGLGGTPEAVGIGIHPTTEEESIGGNAGRGCVRMFPRDAARLFEWCEVGAVVTIR